MKHFILFLVLAVTMLASCKETKQEDIVKPIPKQTKYTLTPFTKSTEYNDAGIAGMTYSKGVFEFDISGQNYQLGQQTPDANNKNCANSGEGQHIHLIIDDQPYAAKYEANFPYDIEDGEHYFLAFLSRSYHESIKTDKARLFFKGDFRDKTLMSTSYITEPMLFYSRPKGTYVGEDTKNVMLDFYLANTHLGNDRQVRATINGEVHILDNWQPYYINGLEMGENTIELALINKSGNLISAPLNPVTRTFTLKASAEAQM